MNQQLDSRILELKTVASKIAELQTQEEEMRREIFGIIENEGLTDGYKNELATVSYVERKTVKIKDQTKLLEDLEKQKIVKYYEEIPAHVELTPKFTKDIKEGLFHHPEVTVETANNLAVRFNK
jgi:hypothetical protein